MSEAASLKAQAPDAAKHPDRLAPTSRLYKTDIYYNSAFEKYAFTDDFGNSMYLVSGRSYLRKLLEKGRDGAVEVPERAKGALFYVLKEVDNHWIVSDVRHDLDGWCGIFSDSVVIPKGKLGPLLEFIDKLEGR